MINEVKIAGVALDLNEVEAEQFTIQHGRGTVTDGPTASTLRCTLLSPTWDTWTPGDEITLADEHGRRFTGQITDARLVDHIAIGGIMHARIEIDAVGGVAELGVRIVGDTPWPSEAAHVRANRILTLAGVPYEIVGNSDVVILARDADRRDALDLLSELSESSNAAVYDRPDGTVVYQSYTVRQESEQWIKWDEAVGTWADQTATWDELAVVGPGSQPITLDPAYTVWEPQWVNTIGTLTNRVRIGYGIPPEPLGGLASRVRRIELRRASQNAEAAEDQLYVELSDATSIARYGERYIYQGTQLATAQDATVRASAILQAQSIPRWALGSVEVLLSSLPESEQDLFRRIECGQRIIVAGLPDPRPDESNELICEGWTWDARKFSDTGWEERITFSLSAVAASFTGSVHWDQLPDELTWNDVDASFTWTDALTITPTAA